MLALALVLVLVLVLVLMLVLVLVLVLVLWSADNHFTSTHDKYYPPLLLRTRVQPLPYMPAGR